MALVFGLLHGLGFASALGTIGLPRSDVPLALLTFNIGVEIGQLIFVASVLVVAWLASRREIPRSILRRARPGLAYGIGTFAAFWFFERISAFAG